MQRSMRHYLPRVSQSEYIISSFTGLTRDRSPLDTQVSAGYGHSCCCTTEGELYTWGSNRDGCLGLPLSVKFINQPRVREANDDTRLKRHPRKHAY